MDPVDRALDISVGFLCGVLLVFAAVALHRLDAPAPKPHMLTLIRSGDDVSLIDTNAPADRGKWIPLSAFKAQWDASVPTWKVTPNKEGD